MAPVNNKTSIHRTAVIGAMVLGALTVVMAMPPVHDAVVRWKFLGMVAAAVGVLTAFVAVGFAFVFATIPGIRKTTELAVSSVGISMVFATCSAMALAGSPIGLTGLTFGTVVGGVTVVLSLIGLWRPIAAEHEKVDVG